MILIYTGKMRGKTVIRILAAIVVFVVGWTCGQVFEDVSPFTLDWSISISDILAILVEIGIAIIIALLVEKGMQNQRVEKDFFISELDEAQKAFIELENNCSRLVPLSLQQTVYQVEKPRKDLSKMWDTLEVRNKSFHDKHKTDFDTLMKNIKTLNSQLSDSNYFKVDEGYKPVNITKGTIHLNNSVSTTIDDTFGAIKDNIFKMKIAINEL